MRVIILVISIAIIAFLFYQISNRDLPQATGPEFNENDTIFDVPDYAKDVVSGAELQNCLRLCAVDPENMETCQADCQTKYGD